MASIKILVVDDNPADIDMLRFALDSHPDPYEMEVLSDGAEALQFVREHRSGNRKPEPCVILLDLHLPKYDGLEILAAIAEAPALRHIHVVMLTGLASPSEKRQIEALGALYRAKSSSLPDLIALAGEIIALCKQHALTATAS